MAFKSKAKALLGVHIAVQTGVGAPVTMTGETNATPSVATAAAWPTVNAGDVVTIAGVATMTGINGNQYPAQKLSTTTIALVGSDFAAAAAPGTGGTATPLTFTNLCEAKTFSGFDGQAQEVDITTLCSVAKEYQLGLQDFGQFQFDMNAVVDDIGQMALDTARASGAALWFRVDLPGTVPGTYIGSYVFQAYVKQKSISGGVGQSLASQVTLRVTGAPVYVSNFPVVP